MTTRDVGFDSTVSGKIMRNFVNRQFRSWWQWISYRYPDFEVASFDMGMIRDPTEEPNHNRYLEWTVEVVRKSDGKRARFTHLEDANVVPGEKRRNFPANDRAILAHLETMLDGGPGGEIIMEDMASTFGVEPKDVRGD